jgi:hypothetical protein
MSVAKWSDFSGEGPFLLVDAKAELLSDSAGRPVMLRLRGPSLMNDMPPVATAWVIAESQVEYLLNVVLRAVLEVDGPSAAYWLLTRLWEHLGDAA